MCTVCASAGTGQCRCPTVGDQSALSSMKAGGSQHGYNGCEEVGPCATSAGQEGHRDIREEDHHQGTGQEGRPGSEEGRSSSEEGRTRSQEGRAGGRHEGPELDEEVSHQQDNGDDYEDDGNEVFCSQDACPHCTYPYCTCPQDACNDAREEGGREVQFCKPH